VPLGTSRRTLWPQAYRFLLQSFLVPCSEAIAMASCWHLVPCTTTSLASCTFSNWFGMAILPPRESKLCHQFKQLGGAEFRNSTKPLTKLIMD